MSNSVLKKVVFGSEIMSVHANLKFRFKPHLRLDLYLDNINLIEFRSCYIHRMIQIFVDFCIQISKSETIIDEKKKQITTTFQTVTSL